MDGIAPPTRPGLASMRARASDAPIRSHLYPTTDLEGWREKAQRMWDLMPERTQQRVIARLIHDNPRVFWMTIIALLDVEQAEQQDEQ